MKLIFGTVKNAVRGKAFTWNVELDRGAGSMVLDCQNGPYVIVGGEEFPYISLEPTFIRPRPGQRVVMLADIYEGKVYRVARWGLERFWREISHLIRERPIFRIMRQNLDESGKQMGPVEHVFEGTAYQCSQESRFDGRTVSFEDKFAPEFKRGVFHFRNHFMVQKDGVWSECSDPRRPSRRFRCYYVDSMGLETELGHGTAYELSILFPRDGVDSLDEFRVDGGKIVWRTVSWDTGNAVVNEVPDPRPEPLPSVELMPTKKVPATKPKKPSAKSSLKAQKSVPVKMPRKEKAPVTILTDLSALDLDVFTKK